MAFHGIKNNNIPGKIRRVDCKIDCNNSKYKLCLKFVWDINISKI